MEGQTSLPPVQARAPHPPTQSLREECSSRRRLTVSHDRNVALSPLRFQRWDPKGCHFEARRQSCLVQGPCIHLEVSAGLRSVGCPLSEREQVAVLRGGR